MYCDCTDLKIIKTFLLLAICVCLRLHFHRVLAQKKTNIEFQDDHAENTRKEIDIILTESSKLSNMSFNLK